MRARLIEDLRAHLSHVSEEARALSSLRGHSSRLCHPTENGDTDTQDTSKDTVSVHVQAELHTNNEESTQTDGKIPSSAVEVKHARHQCPMIFQSLQLLY